MIAICTGTEPQTPDEARQLRALAAPQPYETYTHVMTRLSEHTRRDDVVHWRVQAIRLPPPPSPPPPLSVGLLMRNDQARVLSYQLLSLSHIPALILVLILLSFGLVVSFQAH